MTLNAAFQLNLLLRWGERQRHWALMEIWELPHCKNCFLQGGSFAPKWEILEYGQMSSHMRRSELVKLAFVKREGEKYVERELPAFSGLAKKKTTPLPTGKWAGYCNLPRKCNLTTLLDSRFTFTENSCHCWKAESAVTDDKWANESVREWEFVQCQWMGVYNGPTAAVCRDPNSQASVWIKPCFRQRGAQVNGSWMLINWCHFSAVCHGDLVWGLGKEVGQLRKTINHFFLRWAINGYLKKNSFAF